MNYLQPICIDSFNIYDIFHNDNNELIIITPYRPNAFTIKYISDGNNILTFEIYKCPHNHTIIYTLNIDYNQNIKIMMNDFIIETFVNKYPTFKDEIIFAAIVKDEDEFIIPWIDYHLRLGISRFIIYDNSIHFTLSDILDEYIKKNIVLLIKWTYTFTIGCNNSGQITQQNHSFYAFRNSKYIGLFDIDEYINIQGTHGQLVEGVSNYTGSSPTQPSAFRLAPNIHYFFEQLILKENINVNEIGTFRLLNKFFYNPNNLPVSNSQFFKIFNCDSITKGEREKNFVLPKNILTFSNHMRTSGKQMYDINEKYAFFNHYVYLNKSDRGRNNTNLIDDTILVHLEKNGDWSEPEQLRCKVINIITSFYISKIDNANNNDRNQELVDTLTNNIQSPFVEKIHLYVDDYESYKKLFSLFETEVRTEKITVIDIGKKPLFSDFFRYANEKLHGKVCMITNSDIYIKECQNALIDMLVSQKNLLFALTRYEHDMRPYQLEQYNGGLSHDSYIFNSPLEGDFYKDIEHVQHHWGAEHKLLRVLSKTNVKIQNPCIQIKTVHLHKSAVREPNRPRVADIGSESYFPPMIIKID